MYTFGSATIPETAAERVWLIIGVVFAFVIALFWFGLLCGGVGLHLD